MPLPVPPLLEVHFGPRVIASLNLGFIALDIHVPPSFVYINSPHSEMRWSLWLKSLDGDDALLLRHTLTSRFMTPQSLSAQVAWDDLKKMHRFTGTSRPAYNFLKALPR